MKYLFILGRNIELSVAEIKSYFEKSNNKILNEHLDQKGFLIELEKDLKEREIDNFGGTIAIGQVLSEKIEDLENIEIYLGEKNNISYTVWSISEEETLKEYLKKRFKKEKLKAVFKPQRNSPKVDEEYFSFEKYIGKIIQKCDYEVLEQRDMEKPVRRESLAISPRLAKIMINLSQVKEGETLVDCFCGIGVILQEALLQKIKVIGIDKDKDAIKGASKNLEWFKFPDDEYELINFDSKKIEISKSNVLVTEPNLGEILRKIPSKTKAKKTLQEFENLMTNVLKNLKKNISGKIVFTSPLIKTNNKRLGCNIDKILENTKLKLVLGGFDDFRDNQIVGRQIFVLE